MSAVLEHISKRRLAAALLHPVTLRAGAINAAVCVGFYALVRTTGSMLSASAITLAVYAAYFMFVVCAPPLVVHYAPGSATAQRLLRAIPCLAVGFTPSPWLVNRHLQTLWGALRPLGGQSSRRPPSRTWPEGWRRTHQQRHWPSLPRGSDTCCPTMAVGDASFSAREIFSVSGSTSSARRVAHAGIGQTDVRQPRVFLSE